MTSADLNREALKAEAEGRRTAAEILHRAAKWQAKIEQGHTAVMREPGEEG